MIIHWVHSPIRCLHPQWHQKSQLCGERNQKLPLNLCLILSDTKICCWTNTNQPIEVCFREWQCKEKSHYVWIIYGWSMLKHMFFCRIWRYIYLVLWGGEKQDICHNISKIYDTLALGNLMLILKGRLPFRQLWLNWSFSDDSIKGRTIPEGIALDMFRGSQVSLRKCSNHMMSKLLFPEHILGRQNLLWEFFSHISVGSQPS